MKPRKKQLPTPAFVQKGKNNQARSPLHAAWTKVWLPGLFLVVSVFIAYQPVLKGGFIWDDDHYVTDNRTLHDWDGLKHIWFDWQATPQYYPLVYTTFWLEYHTWGLNPMGYHVVNVLLHALGSILLWRVLKRLELPGAWLAAAIFALHPVNVESVAWITERKNVLSAVFFFAAAWAYLCFAGESENKKRRWGWWFMALLLFVCALLSKTVACSLPAALLLARWWKKQRLEAGDVLSTVPFFIVGVWLGLQTAWLERHHVGASGAEWSFSFVERCLIAGRALWFYAGKLVWPVDLTFVYPRWQMDAGVWWQWLFPVAALAVVATLWLARKRIGRGPLVAVLFFAGTLFPALGFLNVYPMRYTFVADHFQYLAGIGIIVLGANGITLVLGRWWTNQPVLKPMLYGLLLLTLGVLTWQQGKMYADLETLWRATIDRNPACWLAHNNLGYALRQRGQVDEAIIQFQRALAIKPDFADAHNNLGIALFQERQVDEAIIQFQKALAISPDNAEAHNNLGNALRQKGQVDEAIIQFQKALAIKPDFVEAYYDLGNALLQKGSVDEAIIQFQKALAIWPDFTYAHNNLGVALLQKGQRDEAIIHFQKALEIQPGFVKAQSDLAGIAWLLATSPDPSVRNGAKAVELAQQTDQLSGGKNPRMAATLAAAYAEAGRFSEAIATAGRAVQLATDQNDAPLAAALQAQLKSYQADSPFRDLNTPR